MRYKLFLVLVLFLPFFGSAQNVNIGDILCTDGTTVKPSDYASSGKTADGIVFYVDRNNTQGLVVSLSCQSSNIDWVTQEHYYDMYDIPELENYVFSREAMYDFDGYQNTLIIRNAHGADWYPAAWSVDFDHGWFLPSTGQLRWLMAYINEINASLEIVHGTTFVYDHPRWYWTSTERGEAHAVVVSQTGSVCYYPKLNYLYEYQIGVRAIKTCQFTTSPSHHIGDVVTAPDGQKSVVYYISPDDGSYWLVAMNDLPNDYEWGPSTDVTELTNYNDNDQYMALHGVHCGYDATLDLSESIGASPQYASTHVDLANGWHIPSAGQLSKLFASLPFIENILSSNGGSTLLEERYWSSTECSSDKAWTVNFGINFNQAGIFEPEPKNNLHPIRPIWSQSCSAIPPAPDPTPEPGIMVYPNPTKGKFEILLNGIEGNTTIEIFNYLGQLIDRFEVQSLIDGYVLPYSLTGKAAGIYLISITNGHDRYYQKLTKNYAGDYGTYY